MKITPMKDYKAPKYAVGIAALVAMTASATGCVQNAADAMTYETELTYTDVELAGMEETSEETAPPVSDLKNTPEATCTDSDCDTTSPAETIAVVGAGSIFSAAANVIKGVFGGERPKLEGDVPMYTDDTELAGDVEAPMDDTDDIIFAREYAGEFYEAFRNKVSGAISVNMFSGSEQPISANNFIVHCTYADIPRRNEEGIELDNGLEISFVEKDSALWEKISSEQGWDKVYGGFISNSAEIRESAEEKYHYETRKLIIGVDDYYTELSEDFSEAVVSDLFAKGFIK